MCVCVFTLRLSISGISKWKQLTEKEFVATPEFQGFLFSILRLFPWLFFPNHLSVSSPTDYRHAAAPVSATADQNFALLSIRRVTRPEVHKKSGVFCARVHEWTWCCAAVGSDTPAPARTHKQSALNEAELSLAPISLVINNFSLPPYTLINLQSRLQVCVCVCVCAECRVVPARPCALWQIRYMHVHMSTHAKVCYSIMFPLLHI